jgi:hypothetical protein
MKCLVAREKLEEKEDRVLTVNTKPSVESAFKSASVIGNLLQRHFIHHKSHVT